MIFITRLFLIVALAFAPGFAVAQAVDDAFVTADGVPKYDQWENTANRAEEVIEADRASIESLQILRQQLTDWRELFLERQSVNKQRIETLRTQIDALGPIPAEGESEPADISSRRSELNTQLNTALTPARRAEEAHALASSLTSQLDGIIRARQTDQFLRLDPSPVNPVNWPVAASALVSIGTTIKNEIITNYRSEARRQELRDSLPLILLLIAVSVLLLFRSGHWIDIVLARFTKHKIGSNAGFRVLAFFTSLFSFILPFLGLAALLAATERTNLTGFVGDKVLLVMATLLTTLFAGRWLSRQVFPPMYPPKPLLNLSDTQQREARFYAVILALLVTGSFAVGTMSDLGNLIDDLNVTAQAVLLLPTTVLAGLMLFRLGQLILLSTRNEDALANPDGPSGLVIKFLARASMFVAVGGPLLAAVGYTVAGSTMVISTVLTLALLGLLGVLQRLVRDIYAIFVGDSAVSERLIPVLISFALVLMALPVLALIWGARVSDLLDIWTYLANGIQLGNKRISPADFLTFVIVFVIGYTATRLLQGTLRTQVLPRTKIDTGGRNAVVAGTGYVGMFLAAIIAITSAGIDLSSLAIVAGALSVGIGFGLQTIVSNFVSGIILLIERPIGEGDWIEVGTTMGVVKNISVRSTRIETFDRTDVIVPNADLISGTVTNWTKGNLNGRLIVPVGVAYGTDTRKVEKILKEIAEAASGVITMPPPSVIFMGFGADSMDFEIRMILRDVNYKLSTLSDVNHEIAARFAQEGIEIPFAQRDVWLRNPDALTAGPSNTPETKENEPSENNKPDQPDMDEGNV